MSWTYWSNSLPLLRPEGAYFPIMTGDVLYIIPLIRRLLAKTKKQLHTVCLFTIDLLPAFVVLISREIVRQRRRQRLATEYAATYQTTCGVILKTWLSLTVVIICINILAYYWKIIQHRKSGRPMHVNGVPQRWEEPCNKIHRYILIRFIVSVVRVSGCQGVRHVIDK